ncbi:sulfite exporter TauE/SafE family protein [Pseudomonas sp. R2.Fl]|nr:sulfite exporter TauE/SafE family protein [Pseudomonas sp. R2.Fl]
MTFANIPALITSAFPPGVSGDDVLFLAACAFIAGLARGFSGFGAALIFMPLASAVVGPKLAAAILFIADLFTSWPMIPDAVRKANKQQVATMLIGSLAGVPVGTFALAHGDPLFLRWAIILLVCLLLALLASGWRYRGQPTTAATIGVGAVSGVFAGAAQVGGPPVIAYWLGGAHPASLVRANIVFFFALGTVITGVSYWLSDVLTIAAAALALVVGPLFGIGIAIGSRMFGVTSEVHFRQICYGLVALAVVLGLPVLDPWLR